MNHTTEIIKRFEARVFGKKGAPAKREVFYAAVKRVTAWREPYQITDREHYRFTLLRRWETSHASRFKSWKNRQALRIAEAAGQNFDEHGYKRGDYLDTVPMDFVPAYQSKEAPFCDMGGEGLALISIERRRVYAKSSKWYPSSAYTLYLVGKNEAGTYFAHPVAKNCTTVESAVQWIWSGRAKDIISRQGDIALISGNGGPKIPRDGLPHGHVIDEAAGIVRHTTHPDIRLPGKGERIIVGRRAAIYASDATRD